MQRALLLVDGATGVGVLHVFSRGRCVNTLTGRPGRLRELYGQTFEIVTFGVCVICGCTDEECRPCIERTGQPCYWANDEHTLCSACAGALLELGAATARTAKTATATL